MVDDASANWLQFAFYGRISTKDFQDQALSLRWQREAAGDLIAGHGQIMAKFVDVGHSRRLAWANPNLMANRLLRQLRERQVDQPHVA